MVEGAHPCRDLTGTVLKGVSPTDVLTAASRSRNPGLAEAIRNLGFAARPGVDRMYALLDTNTVTTSRILADLVDRELLIKTSAATRGPGVTYGPGPKMPKQKGEPRSATTVSDSSATVQYPDSTAHEPEPNQDPPDDDALDHTGHRP